MFYHRLQLNQPQEISTYSQVSHSLFEPLPQEDQRRIQTLTPSDHIADHLALQGIVYLGPIGRPLGGPPQGPPGMGHGNTPSSREPPPGLPRPPPLQGQYPQRPFQVTPFHFD